MGLDVYLYKYTGSEELTKELLSGLEWVDFEKVTESIRFDSKKYPDHYFKVGYFRSSYNSTGINYLLRDQGLPDLYQIFQVDGEDWVFPDWEDAKARARKTIESFTKEVKAYPLKIETFSLHPQFARQSHSALKLVKQLMEEAKTGQGMKNFSSRDGTFYLEKPLRVHAILPSDFPVGQSIYVVYRLEEKDVLWYQHALEIVLETIDFVLNQEEPERYFFVWST